MKTLSIRAVLKSVSPLPVVLALLFLATGFSCNRLPAQTKPPLLKTKIATPAPLRLQRLSSLIAQEKWPAAAEELARSRDSALEELQFVNRNEPGKIQTLISSQAFLNGEASRLLRKHSEFRLSWIRHVRSRIPDSTQLVQLSIDQIADLAFRFGYDTDNGHELVSTCAARHVDDGNLVQARLMLALLDSRFQRFVPEYKVPPERRLNDKLAAQVAAKLVILRLLETSKRTDSIEPLAANDPASSELLWFQNSFPGSSGTLGHRTGLMKPLLEETVRSIGSMRRSNIPSKMNKTIPGNHLIPWSLVLKASGSGPITSDSTGNDPIAKPANNFLFPFRAGERLVWKKDHGIESCLLDNGAPSFENGNKDNPYLIWENSKRSRRSQPLYGLEPTHLAISENLVFGIFDSGKSNAIVGIDLNLEGQLLPGFPILPDSPEWHFEGSPTVDNGLLYVLLRRYSSTGRSAESWMQCFELRSNQSNAPLPMRWAQRICESEVAMPSNTVWKPEQRKTGPRITLDDCMLFFCNNMGVAGCIRQSDGRIQWLVNYQSENYSITNINRSNLPNERKELAPFVSQDRVFVLPRDNADLIAIDRFSGRLLWSTPQPGFNQFIDCDSNTLLLDGQQLVWIDKRQGNLVCRYPNVIPNTLPGMRSVSNRPTSLSTLHNGRVYFLNSDRLQILNREPVASESGPAFAKLVAQYQLETNIRGGRIMVQNGMIVVTGPHSISAVPLSKIEMLERNQE